MQFNFTTGATCNHHCTLKGWVSVSKIVIDMVRQTLRKNSFKDYKRIFPKIFVLACTPHVVKLKIKYFCSPVYGCVPTYEQIPLEILYWKSLRNIIRQFSVLLGTYNACYTWRPTYVSERLSIRVPALRAHTQRYHPYSVHVHFLSSFFKTRVWTMRHLYSICKKRKYGVSESLLFSLV